MVVLQVVFLTAYRNAAAMIVFPNAKINLGLRITGKRADGYHNIESVFYPVAMRDALELYPTKPAKTELIFSGLPISGGSSENLVYKAWKLLDELHGIGAVTLHLHKAIPMGAGLGGGSADGAFTLRLLNDYFALGLADEVLEGLALQLGSDCPFFIRNTAQLVTGRGEEMQPTAVDLSGYWVALVNPCIHIGTAEAYAAVRPAQPDQPLENLLAQPLQEWQHAVVNDFEASVFPNHAELPAIKSALYEQGAVYASMTGSGSTLYGIFEQRPELQGILGNGWIGRL